MSGAGLAGAPTDLLRQLKDIRGLHPVSAWPLAPGWWGIIVLGAVMFSLSITLFWRHRRWRRSWKNDADQALIRLERHLNKSNVQSIVADLSTSMRRIAMRKFSRLECAALEGHPWLAWLEAHDPSGFTWSEKGLLLIDAPYAPRDKPIPPETVITLIQAARKWVA